MPRLTVCLYTDHPSESLDIKAVAASLEEYGVRTENCGNLFEYLGVNHEALYEAAARLASARVPDIESPLDEIHPPVPHEADFEMKLITGEEKGRGALYDGLWVQRVLRKLISDSLPEESGSDFLHIIFTGRLVGTFEARRYHARVVLLGSPAIISTSGLVEAPARPREYYFIKGGLIRSGRDTRELDEMYRGKFIEYDDPKTTSAISSYALQALFYELSGDAFCENPECCLFNSHWQEDVLRVQYEGKPCARCLEILR
jgi:hypothetical protein